METSTLEPPAVQYKLEVATTPRDIVVAEAPPTPVADAVGRVAKSGQGQTLICHDLLNESQRALAEREAQTLLQTFLGNTAAMSSYGFSALNRINKLARDLLEKDDGELPEVQGLLRDMSRQMDSIKRNTDLSDPKNMAFYQKLTGLWAKIMSALGKAHTTIEFLRTQARSLNGLLDSAEVELEKQMRLLERAITEYDVMLEANEALIIDIVAVIARMEYVRDLAARLASEVQFDPNDPADRRAQQRRTLADVADAMERRRAEFVGRLLVAWTTTPEIQLSRGVLAGLEDKLGVLRHITIPTMRLTAAKWLRLKRGQIAASIANTIAQYSNTIVQEYAGAIATTIPAIAETVYAPTLTPDSIHALASALQTASDGIIAAMDRGAQLRAANEAAIMEVMPVIAGATDRVTDAVITRVIAQVNQALPTDLAAKAQAIPQVLAITR